LPVPATRPGAAPPATGPATTQASTQPTQHTDNQLEAAISTMIGHIVLKGERDVAARGTPVTRPVQ
jgi:hypothetical protein